MFSKNRTSELRCQKLREFSYDPVILIFVLIFNREGSALATLRVRIRTEKNGANQSVKLNPRLRIEPCTHGFRSGLSPRIFCWVLIDRRVRRHSKREFLLQRFFFFSFFPFYFRKMTKSGLGVLPRLQTCFLFIYYRKRGSASYIVREVLSMREREKDTDRERERQRETKVTSPLLR